MSKPINILIDANPLVGNKSGIGHFTYRLVEALAAESADVSITAYYFNFLGRKPTPELPAIDKVIYKEVRFLPTKLLNVLHRFGLQLPLEFFIGFKRFDFMIFPNFVAVPTLRKTPLMPVIHDLGFIDCPEYMSTGNRLYLQRFVKRTLARSTLVGVVSEFTKERLVKVYGVKPRNVLVLPIPYEAKKPLGAISESIRDATKKPFILYVGTLEPRKNIAGLVQALAQTSPKIQDHYRLILAGGWGWKTEGIRSAIEVAKDQLDIVLPGYISDAEKEFLYQQADLICIPSHYEGFGMQLTEALHYKKKLLLSDIPVFHEVAGESATYVDATDPKEFAAALETALSRPVPKHVQAPNWSWSANSKKLLTVIGQHLRRDS